MILPADSLFWHIENAAHDGAFGINSLPVPSEKQAMAGNYKLGRIKLHGFKIAIEQPRNATRSGVDKKTGKEWSTRLAAHYGYLSNTIGNDGDGVDVFVGPYPQSTDIYVINQFVNGQFDEHKVVMAVMDENHARRVYLDSYERGWAGLESMIKATPEQIKWWLKFGDLSRPLSIEKLPYGEAKEMMKSVIWDNAANPVDNTVEMVLYKIRLDDANDLLIFDAVTMKDIMEGAESIQTFDALTSPYNKLNKKMELLQGVMSRASETIQPLSYQMSDPYTSKGVSQITVLFELSDGQTVSIFFHNPDRSPGKVLANDQVISWKWLLNKKDITIVVAPERGVDLNVRDVARRIMKLAERNSALFQKNNGKRAERMKAIDDLKDEITGLETRLSGLNKEIELAKFVKEEKENGNAMEPKEAPFIVTTNGKQKVWAADGNTPMPPVWTGVAMEEEDGTKKYWHVGNDGGEHSFKLLKATNYQDALREAEGMAGAIKKEFTYEIKPVDDGFVIESNNGGGYIIEGKPLPIFMGGSPYKKFKTEKQARAYMIKKGLTEEKKEANEAYMTNGLKSLQDEVERLKLAGIPVPPDMEAESKLPIFKPEDNAKETTANTQGPLPWDGASSQDETRWFGSTIRLTAIDRKRVLRGLSREGEAILHNVINGGGALAVKWPDLEFSTRHSITDEYIVEVVNLVDAFVSTLPTDVRSDMGKRAADAWYNGVKNGNDKLNEQIGLGMYDLIDKGLGFRGYTSVDAAFRVLTDTLAYGEWKGGLGFIDALNRIKSVSNKVAESIKTIQPVSPRNLPQTQSDYNRAGGAISEQLAELKKGAALGLQQISDALFINPDSELSRAYTETVNRLEAARQEYFDLATAAEKEAIQKDEDAEQAAFTPFNPADIKMPTAIQLGAKLINGNGVSRIVDDNGNNVDGWTNGHLADIKKFPEFIKKVTDKVFGEGNTDSETKQSLVEKIISNAKGSKVKVEPIASYNVNTKNNKINSVVLANTDNGVAVAVSVIYYSYFAKLYKSAEFFAQDSKSAVLVKQAGELVGVFMPLRMGKTNVMNRALKAAGREGEPVGEIEPAPPVADESFVHAGYKIYKWLIDGKNKFAVQSNENLKREQRGERQVGGDGVFDTEEAAKKEAENQVLEAEADAKRLEEMRANASAEAGAKAARLAMFADFVAYKGYSAPVAEKAMKALEKRIYASGGELSVKEFIENKVAEGSVVYAYDGKGKRTLEESSGGFFEEKKLGKTAMDYAEFLIQKRDTSAINKTETTNPVAEWMTEVGDNIAKIDAAYKFANATAEFKLWLAESVEANAYPDKKYQLDQPYSPLTSAAAIENAVKKNGATIEWGFFNERVMDSVNWDDDDDELVEFDAIKERQAMLKKVISDGKEYIFKKLSDAVEYCRVYGGKIYTLIAGGDKNNKSDWKEFKWKGVTMDVVQLSRNNLFDAAQGGKIVGIFQEKKYKNWFEFRHASADSWGAKHGFKFEVDIGRGEYRFANILKVVAEIVIDEGDDGKPVTEKWGITKMRKYENGSTGSFLDSISNRNRREEYDDDHDDEDDEDDYEDEDEEGTDVDQEWDSIPDYDEDGNIVLDGDFKGHPFRGNQYRKASRESGTAVGASIRAKKTAKKGSPKEQRKAHKTAFHAHAAAADSVHTKKARLYHRKMARFHAKHAGMSKVSLDSIGF